MDFELIVAFNNKNVIGMNNKIPWHVPNDLKNFKKLTNDNIIVMGRKTFDSLPNGELNNRIHVVITTKPELFNSSNTVYYVNFEESIDIISKLKEKTNKKVFIIGGNDIYNLFFEFCSKFHITTIDNDSEGDVYFQYNIDHFKNNFSKVIEKFYVSYEKNNFEFTDSPSKANPNFIYYLFSRGSTSIC